MIRKHRRYTADDLMHAHLDGIASGSRPRSWDSLKTPTTTPP